MSDLIDRIREAKALIDATPPLPTEMELLGQTFQVRPSVGNLYGLDLFRTDTLMASFTPRTVLGVERWPR